MQQYCPEYGDSCSNVVYQTVDVGLPISLVPAIAIGTIKVVCAGEPQVQCCQTPCGGLELQITQTLTYKIPMEHSAQAFSGEITSQCQKCIPTINCMPRGY